MAPRKGKQLRHGGHGAAIGVAPPSAPAHKTIILYIQNRKNASYTLLYIRGAKGTVKKGGKIHIF